MKKTILSFYLLTCCAALCSAGNEEFALNGKRLTDIAALPLAIIPAVPSLVSMQPDVRGPLIRLISVVVNESRLEFRGYAEDGASVISSFALRYPENPEASYRAVPAADGDCDSQREDFLVSIPYPRDGILKFSARDAFANESVLTLYLTVRPDYQGYQVYLSRDALGASEEKFENFSIQYTPGVSEAQIKTVREKLLNLKRVADENFGFKNYNYVPVMLYQPEESATFENFRGNAPFGTFTFPVQASSIEPDKFDYTLDSWIPHELGDHTTRAYAPDSLIRWLSEGAGDYLGYLYQKQYFPDKSASYLVRVRIYHSQYGDQDLAVNLLDGKFSSRHYLCSAAQFFGIAKERGGEVFHGLFTRLNQYEPAVSTEVAAREILGEITGKNITAEISACSTAKAVKTLEDFGK